MRPPRRLSRLLTVLVTTLVTGVTGALVLPGPAAQAARPTTRLVLEVSGCEGCRVLPSSSIEDGTVWETEPGTVRGGRVVFTVPTKRTRGLRLVLDAPWEGETGGVAHVVMRYQGSKPGDRVTTYAATSARKGSVCFAGTRARRLTMDVTVTRTMLDGNTPDGSEVVAALAFASVTQRFLKPLELVRDGYFAAQGVPLCSG